MNSRRSFLGAVLAATTLATVGGTALAEGTKARDGDRSAGEYVDDKTLETKVKSTLIATEEVKARNIEVQARNGVVTLGGTVHSSAEAELAVTKAKSVSGVKTVNSNLRVAKD
ncbi:BON domain-containing protein [Azoarcus olearius]|uniref:Conserved hypothetical secreted protein n=1 Tax=Azoarcus sp. (strain BH72) TaxID=418699 RepID=A1K6C6_AZOSB|nr:BON domain-containing protein [Azoarcus olearius]ANQ84952.1 hypothetical protein dqs_1914 [Azoarcus olearius]CAL94381.1 conserved hypothetical secreted protein [Azoarcus olearius]